MTRRNWSRDETELMMECAAKGLGIPKTREVLEQNGWPRSEASINGKYYRSTGFTFPVATTAAEYLDKQMEIVEAVDDLTKDIVLEEEIVDAPFDIEEIQRQGNIVRNIIMIFFAATVVGIGWYNGYY